MAGDWMKVEHSTPDKPEILAIASELKISPDEAFGICFRMWRWFDQHTVNGNAPGVTSSLLDRYLGVTGFATVALKVGWLCNGDGGLTQPNFDYHNGETAKQRGLSAKRAKAYREKTPSRKPSRKKNESGVTPSSLLYHVLESLKRIPEELRGEEFQVTWDKWVAHRKEKGSPLHDTMADSQLKMLAAKGRAAAIVMIEHTVTMGWQGLRDPDCRDTGAIPVPKNQALFDKLNKEFQEQGESIDAD